MKKKILLIITLLLLPISVSASNGESPFPLPIAIGVEAFVTIHMSLFVLLPLSKLLAKPNEDKKLFKILFISRIIILIIGDFMTPMFAMIDFMAVFIGGFLIVPLVAFAKKDKTVTVNQNMPATTQSTVIQVQLVCSKCGQAIKETDKFCGSCGTPVTIEPQAQQPAVKLEKKEIVIDPIYNCSEEILLSNIIDEELKKVNFTGKETLESMIKRKNNIIIISSIINLILLSLVFFHISWIVFLLLIVNVIVCITFIKKYNLKKYIIKEVKARGDEKISYVISSIMATVVQPTDQKVTSKKYLNIALIILSVILPLLVFNKPHMLFEKYNDSYYVRFYTIGLTNPDTIEIPEEYKGKKVVGIRGNVFQNISSVKKVVLPKTIDTIRGNAFSGDSNLEEINLPKGLKYIGGGAFKSCSSLKSIVIPDSVTEMHGEVFQYCSSLENVVLSKNITEIRGNSFEECTSLTTIDIPEGVTRIGGHAFYGCSSLSDVKIPTTINEIGSSAFRQCSLLYNVSIPSSAYVNERAFKESPTSINYY